MELKGKKIHFLGDSITQGHGASDEAHGFVSVFGRKTGALVRNYGVGGTRIAKQKTPSQWEWFDLDFNQRADQMDADADVVVVFGGTNDFGHGDAPFGTMDDSTEFTFCGAVKCLLEKLINRYPEARIVMATPLHRLGENDPVNEIGIERPLLSEYVRAEKEIAAMYSVSVIDLWATSGIQPCVPAQKELFTADGLHPNDKGAERVADVMIAFLKTL